MREGGFSIVNRTRQKTPGLPFAKMKEAVLGKKYELSVALVTPAEARRITRKTKNKDKASNVLAFRLSKNSGELILCPSTARKQAPQFGKTPRTMLAYLFIHGLLHLEGYTHSARMEKQERVFMKRFGF